MKNIIMISCCRSGHNFVMDQIRSWLPGEANLINFEDTRPEQYHERLNTWKFGGLLEDDLEVKVVIVVRDLLNWWASYLTWIRNYGMEESKIQYAFDIWMQQVHEALDITHHIKDKISVYYDGFKVIPSIRKWACLQLGGNYNEELINAVPEAGGGSSFDNLPGSEMQTHLRWEHLINDPFYLHMLSVNKEAMTLYRENFTPSPEQIQLLNLL